MVQCVLRLLKLACRAARTAGTWLAGSGCMSTEGTASSGYQCACAFANRQLAWRPEARCLAGAHSATGGDWPPACRHRRGHVPTEQYRLGHVSGRRWDTAQWKCEAPDGGESGYGIGISSKEFEVLCQGK